MWIVEMSLYVYQTDQGWNVFPQSSLSWAGFIPPTNHSLVDQSFAVFIGAKQWHCPISFCPLGVWRFSEQSIFPWLLTGSVMNRPLFAPLAVCEELALIRRTPTQMAGNTAGRAKMTEFY